MPCYQASDTLWLFIQTRVNAEELSGEQEPLKAEKKGRDLGCSRGVSLGLVSFVNFLILCPVWF